MDKDKFIKITIGITALVVIGSAAYFIFRKKDPFQIKVQKLRKLIEQSFHNAEQSLHLLTQQRISTKSDQKLQTKICYIRQLQQIIKMSSSYTHNPFQPPFPKGLVIDEIAPKHRLLYSKVYLFKNHLLVTTQQFQNQSNRLSLDDFQAISLTIKATDGVFFFNCGTNAGDFQTHKHIEVLPIDVLKLPIIAQIIRSVQKDTLIKVANNKLSIKQSIYLFKGFDFLHGIIPLPEYFIQENNYIQLKKWFKTAEEILFNYCFNNFNLSSKGCYNLIGCSKFLLLVPRKTLNAIGKIKINGLCLMGLILIDGSQQFDETSLPSPSDILKQVTFQIPTKL